MQQQTEQKSSVEKIPTHSVLSPKIELYHPPRLPSRPRAKGRIQSTALFLVSNQKMTKVPIASNNVFFSSGKMDQYKGLSSDLSLQTTW